MGCELKVVGPMIAKPHVEGGKQRGVCGRMRDDTPDATAQVGAHDRELRKLGPSLKKAATKDDDR